MQAIYDSRALPLQRYKVRGKSSFVIIRVPLVLLKIVHQTAPQWTMCDSPAAHQQLQQSRPSPSSFSNADQPWLGTSLSFGSSWVQPQDGISLSLSNPALQVAVARATSTEVLGPNSNIFLFSVCKSLLFSSLHSPFSRLLLANPCGRYLPSTQVKGTWPCVRDCFSKAGESCRK